MRTLVWFTRDLRVHDHPALTSACRAGSVLPLFVADPRLLTRSPNRSRFLRDALEDLDRSLGMRGARLLVRSGRPETVVPDVARRSGCDAIHVTHDVTSVARDRLAAVRSACGDRIELREFAGHAVVEPGEVSPAGKEAYRVFTPYHRAWRGAQRRRVLPAPRHVRPVEASAAARRSSFRAPAPTARSLPPGGEAAARDALRRFLRRGAARYGTDRDRLDLEATSRLSPYLRFGCVSAAEVAARASTHDAGDFERQLAWRDFFLQLVHEDPSRTRTDLRPYRSPRWRDDPPALQAWRRGETGEPLVDAAMHQLAAEGWLPNRARLVAASYLTRTLEIDWRHGAAHFDRHLVDGDPASNTGNWQWVAGTGANPRRGRPFNLERQAARFDPDGAYRRRWA